MTQDGFRFGLTPSPIGITARLLILCSLAVGCSGQTVLHSSERIFTLSVTGTPHLRFTATTFRSLVGRQSDRQTEDYEVPSELHTKALALFATIQKRSEAGTIIVHLTDTGALTKTASTSAPFGLVSISSEMPKWGAPRQTEFRVTGTSKYAKLMMTNETGDIVEKIVPIPFQKEFFSKEGWILALIGQKTPVTRPDPLRADPHAIEVLDDGRTGSLRVQVVVNGMPIGDTETEEPYGVARTLVKVP